MIRIRTTAALALLLPLITACDVAGTGGEAPASANAAANRQGLAPSAQPVRTIIPERYRGTWDASAAACDAHAGEMRLVVEGQRLRFYESVASVESVRPAGRGRIEVDLALQGEGETWQETRTLRLLPHGQLEVGVGGIATSRVRCGDVPASARSADWRTESSEEGIGLFLAGAGGTRTVAFFCPSGTEGLLVNVPAFRPVGSEERMTFGSGDIATTLVADSAGDPVRGGVSGRGPLPETLAEILRGSDGIGVNYGAQNSGPHPPPSEEMASRFLDGCRD